MYILTLQLLIDSAARGDISGGQMECQQRIERELVIDINRFKPHHFEYYSSVKIVMQKT